MTGHSHEQWTDETLRLVTSMQESMQDWARRSFADAGTGSATDGTAQPGSEHTGADCQWCPLCQFVAVLRGDRPEITAKVAEAGTAVITAMRALLDAAVDASGSPSAGKHASPARTSDAQPRVQRINLSAES